MNNLNLANKVFNELNVLILGGLNSGISLYMQNRTVSCDKVLKSGGKGAI